MATRSYRCAALAATLHHVLAALRWNDVRVSVDAPARPPFARRRLRSSAWHSCRTYSDRNHPRRLPADGGGCVAGSSYQFRRPHRSACCSSPSWSGPHSSPSRDCSRGRYLSCHHRHLGPQSFCSCRTSGRRLDGFSRRTLLPLSAPQEQAGVCPLTPFLELRKVGFQFASKTALDPLNLTLEAGSFTPLIGPNAVGKTTLLRIMSGPLPATRGEVLLNGQPLHTLSAEQRAQRVAMVPQQLDVPFDFTVQQIVEQVRTPYLGMLRGLLREDRAAVDRALDLIDATSLRHRVFNELSGGERQRVKITLGLAHQPPLLLLDEPTPNPH